MSTVYLLRIFLSPIVNAVTVPLIPDDWNVTVSPVCIIESFL